jgi:ubiquinone/menaquinone biosynthesis C-methylase UbiE
MSEDRHIPVFLLNNPLRRLMESPERLAKEYVRQGMVVADIGCGAGFYTIAMARATGPEGLVYAVDSDQVAVERLRNTVEREGLSNVKTFVSPAEKLDFIPTASVDFVLSKDLLCCTIKHREVMREMRRIVKPNGTIHVSIRSFPFSKDPREVRREEWRELISEFKVLNSKSGLTSSWAVLRPK